MQVRVEDPVIYRVPYPKFRVKICISSLLTIQQDRQFLRGSEKKIIFHFFYRLVVIQNAFENDCLVKYIYESKSKSLKIDSMHFY